MITKEVIILWTPRILCTAAILFVSMFALDSFQPGMPFGQQMQNFLMHMIPTFVLLLLLRIAWKWPFVGGILFTVVAISLSPIIYTMNYHRTHSVGTSLIVILMITVPFVLVGILFMVSHFRKSKGKYNS